MNALSLNPYASFNMKSKFGVGAYELFLFGQNDTPERLRMITYRQQDRVVSAAKTVL